MPDIQITVSPALKSALQAAGLLDMDALFLRADLETVKAKLESRQTFRLSTPVGVFYIKRYVRPDKPALAGIGVRRFSSQAAREYEVLQRLQELGVPAPEPAAYLEERNAGRLTRAAVITVGLPVIGNLEQAASSAPPPLRAKWAVELGGLLRRMHNNGVNHRDFYFVHILIDADGRLYVADLNRADIRRRVGRRWRVKDVAALLHSAPAAVTRTDKARFARAYLGGRLREHKAFIRAVLRKAARITAHTRKRVQQGTPNYHLGQD